MYMLLDLGNTYMNMYMQCRYHSSSYYSPPGRHLPSWFRSIAPKTALEVHEESWNAYPYTKTKFSVPYVEKFSLEIETKFEADGGYQVSGWEGEEGGGGGGGGGGRRRGREREERDGGEEEEVGGGRRGREGEGGRGEGWGWGEEEGEGWRGRERRGVGGGRGGRREREEREEKGRKEAVRDRAAVV